jgi:hypothetical protein
MRHSITELNPETIYLDYLNNFMTVEKLAEHYGLTVEEAMVLIDRGRKVNWELTWGHLQQVKI